MLAEQEEDEDEPAANAKTEDASQDTSMDVDEAVVLDDEDEDMEVQPKQKRKRAEKKVIPVGRNGKKKRKITKTRHFKGADGYMRKCLSTSLFFLFCVECIISRNRGLFRLGEYR